jgi:hypothetical protein
VRHAIEASDECKVKNTVLKTGKTLTNFFLKKSTLLLKQLKMKQLLLTFMSIALLVVFCKAQFPAFTNFEGVKYYVNTRGDSATKKYRAIYGIGDTINSYFAYSLSKRAKETAQMFSDTTNRNKVINDNTLSPSEKNSRLNNFTDSASFYEDVSAYYASINKFTGSPKIPARILPVRHSYQARFFYQNSPETDSTEKKR